MTLEYYRALLAQRQRIEAFQRHIKDVVRPGDRVLELGTGLGTFSFFAADAGASQVWAVEGNPIINVAKAIARVNGYRDRIEFIEGWFPKVSIPGRADVLIFEDFPRKLIDAKLYMVLRQVYRDYLEPGARVIPGKARLFVAPLSSEDIWKTVAAFGSSDDIAYGLDWSASREYLLNTPRPVAVSRDALASKPAVVAEVEFHPLPEVESLRGAASWKFDADCEIHGLLYWFELELSRGEWVSNAPGETGPWGQLFLPALFPIAVKAGDEVTARVGPEPKAEGVPGWLSWEIECGDIRSTGHEFNSFPASLGDLIPTSPSHVPELTEDGKLATKVLELADGKRTFAQIAEEIRSSGDCDLDHEETLSLVAEVLRGKIRGVRSGDVLKVEAANE